MANNLLRTSLEKSQRLVDLGIDIETVDMYYIPYKNRSPRLLIKNDAFPYDLLEITIVWSLSVLSDLLPSFIKYNDKKYVLTILNIGELFNSIPKNAR